MRGMCSQCEENSRKPSTFLCFLFIYFCFHILYTGNGISCSIDGIWEFLEMTRGLLMKRIQR